MNAEFQPSDELVSLLVALCDGELDPQQRQRLNELIKTDPDARSYYVEFMSLGAMLDSRYEGPPPLEIPLDEPGAFVSRRSSTSWGGLALAASLFVASGLGLAVYAWRGGSEPPPIATLLHSDGVQWDNGAGTAVSEGEAFEPGRRRLATGVARIKLASGVILALAAPAEFELTGENEFELFRGKVRAFVPPPARGFTVRVQEIRIVDLGTEFGVLTDKHDEVEVHVFAGKVSVSQQIHLEAGHAIHIDHKHQFRDVGCQAKGFPSIQP